MADFERHVNKIMIISYGIMIPLHIAIIVVAFFNPGNVWDDTVPDGEQEGKWGRLAVTLIWFIAADALAVFALGGIAALTMSKHWAAKVFLYPIAIIMWLAVIAGAGGIVALPIFIMGVLVNGS